MDAFSLALSIGTLGLTKKEIITLSSIVGAFHFFMPLIGTMVGRIFVSNVHVDANILAGIIFMYIAIQMFKDFKSGEEEIFKLSLPGMLVFALGVSLDSFGVGFALQLSGPAIVKSFLVFTIVSSIFTFLGLNLGKVLTSLVGEYSILVGSLMMATLSVLNFCHFLF